MFWSERRRRRILEQAAARERAEQRAAIARINQLAGGYPTMKLPIIQPASPQRAPLLTRGQAARTERRQR